LKQFISENVNGILGTTILHLLVFIFLLVVQIGKIREYKSEPILVEFDQEEIPIEEVITPEDYYANYTEAQEKAGEGLRSLVSNVNQSNDEDISTQSYEQEVMDELGIQTLKPEMPKENQEEFSLEPNKEQVPDKPPAFINNRIVRDNTVVSYDLRDRWHRFIYIPAYKCKGGGTVMIRIEVDQHGVVSSANIISEGSTKDQCLLDEAVNSALQAVFNSNPTAPSKQSGVMTFTFIAQ
jgi:TonB family protein